MKRTSVTAIILIAVIVAATTTACAGPKFTTGPKFGVNIMTFAGKDAKDDYLFPYTDKGYIPGGYIGWMISADINEYLTIRIEPGYSQRGGDWEQNYNYFDTTGTVNEYIRLEYFAIPLVAQVTLPEKKFRPFACGGLSIAFNTGSSLKVEDEAYYNGQKVNYYEFYSDE